MTMPPIAAPGAALGGVDLCTPLGGALGNVCVQAEVAQQAASGTAAAAGAAVAGAASRAVNLGSTASDVVSGAGSTSTAANVASTVIGAATGADTSTIARIASFIDSPSAFINEGSGYVYPMLARSLTNPDLLPLKDPTVLNVYLWVAIFGIVIAFIAAVALLVTGYTPAALVHVASRFGGYLVALIVTPIVFVTMNEGVHLIAQFFATGTAGGFASWMNSTSTSIDPTFIGTLFPGASFGFQLLANAGFAVVGIILLIEQMIWAGIITAVYVLSPFYNIAWIFPRAGQGTSTGSQRSVIYQYMNTVGGLFFTLPVVSIILNLAASLLTSTEPAAVFVGAGMLTISILSPLALFAYFPLMNVAGGQGQVGRQSILPVILASNYASRALRGLRK